MRLCGRECPWSQRPIRCRFAETSGLDGSETSMGSGGLLESVMVLFAVGTAIGRNIMNLLQFPGACESIRKT